MTKDGQRRGPGRRPGENRTREAILGAARKRFGEHGWLLRLGRQEDIRRYRGKLQWSGDLDEMRADR